MASWKLPYSIPKFTTEEFEKMRTDYIAKYGYTIYVPGWEDIVHLPLEKGFTETEEARWAAKDWSFFTPERLEELKAIKERRKRMYLRLLGSPQPHILRNRGSILVALDNNQDALSTLSMIIRIAYTVVPLVWKKILTGPVGWIMTASDILNLCTYVMTPERSAIRTKRIKDAITDKNPFSRKARLKRSMKLFREKISTGTVIEALQTTDQVFGYGISLGAIMNLPFDMAFGTARRIDGKKVTMLEPVETPHFWKSQASLAWKSLTTLFTTEKIFDVAEVLPMMILSHLTAVAMHVITPSLDPKNQIQTLDQFLVKALEPKKPYLREVMEESGDDPDGFTGWPMTGEKFSSCTRIANEGYKISQKNFKDACYAGRNDMATFYGAQRANDAAHFMLATVGGDDAVEYDYIAAEKATHGLLNAGYRLPWYMFAQNIPEEDYKDFYSGDIIDEMKTKAFPAYRNIAGELIDPISYQQKYGKQMPEDTSGTESEKDILNYYFHIASPPWHMQTPSQAKSFMHSITFNVLLNYLNEHEKEDTTPSTPRLKQYMNDFLKTQFPINVNTGDTSEPTLDILPTLTEVPK